MAKRLIIFWSMVRAHCGPRFKSFPYGKDLKKYLSGLVLTSEFLLILRRFRADIILVAVKQKLCSLHKLLKPWSKIRFRQFKYFILRGFLRLNDSGILTKILRHPVCSLSFPGANLKVESSEISITNKCTPSYSL